MRHIWWQLTFAIGYIRSNPSILGIEIDMYALCNRILMIVWDMWNTFEDDNCLSMDLLGPSLCLKKCILNNIYLKAEKSLTYGEIWLSWYFELCGTILGPNSLFLGPNSKVFCPHVTTSIQISSLSRIVLSLYQQLFSQ